MKVKPFNPDNWGVGVFGFKCPGCGETHIIYTDPANPSKNKEKSVWAFNGDLNNPTFSPSIMYRTGHYIDDLNEEQKAHIMEQEEKYRGIICHSTVTSGFINILSDSTQSANQTLELKEIGDGSTD